MDGLGGLVAGVIAWYHDTFLKKAIGLFGKVIWRCCDSIIKRLGLRSLYTNRKRRLILWTAGGLDKKALGVVGILATFIKLKKQVYVNTTNAESL